MASGWQALGNAIGGGNKLPSELAYEQGQSLGANTQDALAQARARIDQNNAKEQADQALSGAIPDPKTRAIVVNAIQGGYDPRNTTGSLLDMNKLATQQSTADPNTPDDQVARNMASQGINPDLARAVGTDGNVINQLHPSQGVHIAPLGAAIAGSTVAKSNADVAAANAEAALRTREANNPELFHPGAGTSGLDDNAAYVAAVRYNQTGILPSLGMGSAAASDRRHILSFAANLASDPQWAPSSFSNGASQGAASVPGSAPSGAAPATHPTLAQAQAPVITAATTKANTSSLADTTKRTAVADASEATAAANLQLAQHYLTGADETGSPIINTIQNKVKAGLLGDPDVASYSNALATAANEYARVVSMATGAQGITDAARKEGEALFNPNLAPAQLSANIKVALAEMGNRTGSMHTQIELLKRGIGAGQSTAAPNLTAPAAPVSASGPPAGQSGAIPLDQYLKSKGF